MINIFTVAAAIIVLFIILLLFKAVVKKSFCVICASVSLTWLALLVLYKLDYFADGVLLALLMGQSIVGIYYLIEKKTDEKYHIFRLPFLLTLLAVFYLIIKPSGEAIWLAAVLLAVLWLILITIYGYRENPKINSIVKKLIECCKNW